MKKKSKLIIIILVLIFFAIGILFFSRMIINKEETNILKEQQTEKNLQQKYAEKALNYLREKYNRDFVLTLYDDGYKIKEIWFDTTFECGHDKNIKQYVYEVTTELPFTSYVTVWIDFTTGEETIHEGNGVKSIRDDTSFEYYYNYYIEKIRLKESIDNYWEDTGINYSIDYSSNNFALIIHIDQSFKEEIINNYNNVEILSQLERNPIEIELYYNDCWFKIGLEDSIEVIKNKFIFITEICNYMDNNFYGLYTYENIYKEGNFIDYDRSAYKNKCEFKTRI